MRTLAELKPVPEITAYTKYYEHDGMLRAYANRAMFLALLFGVIACEEIAAVELHAFYDFELGL